MIIYIQDYIHLTVFCCVSLETERLWIRSEQYHVDARHVLKLVELITVEGG